MDLSIRKLSELTYHEKRAVVWDRLTMGFILLLLLLPFPFACFESWPGGNIISERLVMPWSRFKICYISFPEGEAVQETYHFTWKGEIMPRSIAPLLLSILTPDVPVLKWQESPETPLHDVFLHGDFLKVRTYWQPVLFWSLKMGWRIFSTAVSG